VLTEEHRRLSGDRRGVERWRRWGPYVSERSWGTVREDYSPDGDAWNFLSHDHARTKAYRWGEDGIAGICDRYQVLVFAFAFWNGRDPILKERLFGLTPDEANHGEDVKEYYYYLDNTPSHAYMRYLYKYPHASFPYQRLIDENRSRSRHEPEYELLDTGVFDEDRYFDIFIEYAKESEEDIAIRVEIWNRGPEDEEIHVLPHLWFRNTWSWSGAPLAQPHITLAESGERCVTILADDTDAPPLRNITHSYRLGPRYLSGPPGGSSLFTDNETNAPAVFGTGHQSKSQFTKDAFHRAIIQGEAESTNPEQSGTKACLHYRRTVPAAGSVTLLFRFSDDAKRDPLIDVDDVIMLRRAKADEFYESLHPPGASEDERLIQRQALAGMLWSKQIYLFDVEHWLDGDNPELPPPPSRQHIRNWHWRHLNSMRILSMPDKWEYPWFAAWDLAFHAVPLALVDPEFAKEQLWLMLFEQFQHPNGQLPAYEWEFSDTNPPVHAWAVWRVYNMEKQRTGRGDRAFLERCFHKLLLNFTWWVNKVDPEGHNVFEGGFLGLDNIAIFDRSERLPGGATLAEADATGWMAMFSLNLMRIALELAEENRVYEGLAVKFFEHYVYIGAAMKRMGGRGYQLWNDEDGFFYDVLRFPDGHFETFSVRSLVGLIPLFAVDALPQETIEPFPEFRESFHWFLANRQDLVNHCIVTLRGPNRDVHLLSIVTPEQLSRILSIATDPDEFLSPVGLRSLSRRHLDHPYRFGDREVGYEPGEARTALKGGNSNWRGPVWFPTTFMMIESLVQLARACGTTFDLGLKGLDGSSCTPDQVAEVFANRMISIFTRDGRGRRPVFGDRDLLHEDPHWRDLIPFHEYFHGDTGAGLGASHQTGWTGLVATLIDEWRR
jgi:hypothetical protein